jgi:hypothetical protein
LLFLQHSVDKITSKELFAMSAPAPVAAQPLSWAYLTAMLTALPVIRAGQNLAAALSATLIPVNLPSFSREPQSLQYTFGNEKGGGMKHMVFILLGVLLVVGAVSEGLAASAKAMAMRQANGLTAFTPPQKFLAGNFVADELNPTVIFGPVQAFASSRKCPTAWLIEAGDKNLLGEEDVPAEYTLYLEEDCPDQVVYYVFIDQSGLTPQQWIDWRFKFHGQTKTEPEYGPTKSKLEKACTAGCGVGAELRFIQKNGELVDKSPEAVLLKDLKYKAIYDLDRQQKITN